MTSISWQTILVTGIVVAISGLAFGDNEVELTGILLVVVAIVGDLITDRFSKKEEP